MRILPSLFDDLKALIIYKINKIYIVKKKKKKNIKL